MPSRKLRESVPVRVKMPAPGAVSRREGGGSWERAALEIQRVRAVNSRVALRGATGGRLGRGSTSRPCNVNSMEGRRGDPPFGEERKDSLSPSVFEPPNTPESEVPR
ncbi:hypothetical protein NDU88_009059 [Pleurodeles waltl]|uniref:Uncharacterized protein n=1 Tax=Pleurodeles waltl TaxID=8319 RepID=A0AAV7QQH0_PLEWA|nr:hypothetical protein NDU88_009059 [Pleurodeles waltl]